MGIVFTLTLSLAAAVAWARTLRSCLDGRLRIPMLVPLLLVTTGLALLALPHIDPPPSSLTEAGLGVVAGTVAAQMTIDLSVRRLPLVPSLTATAVFLLSLLASDTDRIAGAFGGLTTMTLVAAVLRWLGRGQLGRGDVYFSLLLGAVIGWLDPWAIATAWALTTFSAAVFAGAGLRTGRLARDSAVPFGPFMVLGSVSAMALTLASNS